MQAHHARPNLFVDETASSRVETFLRGMETERRRSAYLRGTAFAVVAILAVVASLTSAGLESGPGAAVASLMAAVR
jgi:hypothetical protein